MQDLKDCCSTGGEKGHARTDIMNQFKQEKYMNSIPNMLFKQRSMGKHFSFEQVKIKDPNNARTSDFEGPPSERIVRAGRVD